MLLKNFRKKRSEIKVYVLDNNGVRLIFWEKGLENETYLLQRNKRIIFN
ncbi:hypothetical protein Q7O_002255 [Pectobacterium carotovorum subsp. carotovorum PCCS1]|nr:hypothetical protein [Pectobacterium carotovorum subsp. carotovorum PCCS1]